MPLERGAQLGPYEVLALLGAGGMGEVYCGRDTRLDRAVAIKVLPPQLAASPELRQRFEREARAISSLTHPHICALYDVGHESGMDFLVMEYLEGETLVDRLAKGPLPMPLVLRNGIEIVQALDHAHRHGIVHRDLKPGNVVLTRSGAKLLDFGLAKLVRAGSQDAPGSVSQLTTEDRPLTDHGTMLGTLQYMAPEQLEGKEADARTDIFAVGVLLHEMATGKRAFTGTSRASLIASILGTEPPPISSLQPMSPPAFDHVVKTCLAKDPDDRWQTAHDVMAELRWISDTASQVSGAAPAVQERRRRVRVAWAAALAGVAIVAGTAGWRMGALEVPPASPLYLAVEFPPDAPLYPGNRLAFSLSPSGRQLAYVGRKSGWGHLVLRSFDAPEGKPIPGAEIPANDEGHPFFSPNGEWVAFFAEGKLKKAPVSGGPPVVLCAASAGRGGSWGDDDRIVFAPSVSSGLSRVAAEGGEPESLTKVDAAQGETSHRWPDVLPGSDAVLFTVGSGGSWATAQIVVQSLKTGARRRLADGAFPRFVPTGHVIFARGPAILALPFDLKTLTPTGPPVPLLGDVETNYSTGAGAAQVSVAKSGALAYLASGAVERSLVWLDRNGHLRDVPAPARPYVESALSPRGDRAALTIENGPDLDMWSYDLERGTLTRLTFGGNNETPVWTPDGQRIAFSAATGAGLQTIKWLPADGSGAAEDLVRIGGGWQWPTSFSPDGKTLTMQVASPETDFDIWVLPLQGERKPKPLIQTPYDERQAYFSPDGRYIAYRSAETGKPQIYLQRYPGPGGKRQVTSEGGYNLRWSGTGREILYIAGDRREKMMAVAIEAGLELRVGKPRLLFELPEALVAGGVDFDISPDGQRFLVIKPGPRESQPAHLELVLNWFGELRRRVPSGPR